VTTVVPRLKIVPGFLVEVNDRVPPQLSDTVGMVQLTVAWQEGLALTVIFEGQPVIRGFVLS